MDKKVTELLRCKQTVSRVRTGDRVPVAVSGHASTVLVTATRPGYMLMNRYQVIHVSLEELETADQERDRLDRMPVDVPVHEPSVPDGVPEPADQIYRCACEGKTYSKRTWWAWEQRMKRARHNGELQEREEELWQCRPGAACVPLDWPVGWSDGGLCLRCGQTIVVDLPEAD